MRCFPGAFNTELVIGQNPVTRDLGPSGRGYRALNATFFHEERKVELSLEFPVALVVSPLPPS